MDLKASSITADILNILSDGKKHTMQEIADEVEVCERTVRRHIQSLSYRYPIETFCGGIERGGVWLQKEYCDGAKIFTKEEIEIISKGLNMVKDSGCQSESLRKLINIFK